jgi:hypothetical protein
LPNLVADTVGTVVHLDRAFRLYVIDLRAPEIRSSGPSTGPSRRMAMKRRAANEVKVSYGALWEFFAREGITFKKRARAPAGSASV